MRKGVLLFVAIVVLVSVLLIILHQKSNPAPFPEQPLVGAANSNSQPTTLPKTSSQGVVQSVAGGMQPTGNQEPAPKGQTVQEIISEENSKSQDFYGKVIDQYGQSINAADVSGT